ncbi:MAG: helix-turn-helix domain-containing protein [Bacteroidales bacterium]|nr:helix-turn-helix domain-containing protein [Bacteroidales bacterium]
MKLILMLTTLLAATQLRAIDATQFSSIHLGRDQGLVNQHVFSLCQSADGVVWWSSKHSVYRYNGHSVRPYRLDEGIPYNELSGRTLALATGAENSLYAYDNKGKIYRYDTLQDAFLPVADIAALLGRPVLLNHLFPDADGLCLSMNEGVFRLVQDSLHPMLEGLYANCVAKVGADLLLCTTDGVYRLKDGQEKAEFFLPLNVVSTHFDAAEGIIWLGSFAQGVKTATLDGTKVSDVEGVPQNPIRALVPYTDGSLLVGVDGGGIYGVAPGSRKAVKYFDANEGPQGLLHGNGIYALLPDSWGNLFVGTYSGGIDILRPSNGAARVFSQLPNIHVNCVNQLPDGRLLLGTDDGASLLTPSTGKWEQLFPGSVILNTETDPKDGSLLLASFGHGVYRTKGQPLTLENSALRDNHVYSLFRDRDGHLWMGCLAGDLAEQTPQGMRYYPVRNVQDILQLPDGRIAVATADGVKLITPGNPQPEDLAFDLQLPDRSAVNRYIVNLYLHQDKELWMASDGGGLYIYKLESGACRQLTREDGLPGNSVCSLVPDKFGRVWVATEYGLCALEDGKVLPANYEQALDREYIRGAGVLLQDGRILLGTTDGAVIMDPSRMGQARYQAPLRLTGVQFQARSREEQREQTRRLLEEGRLDLRYSQNTFELHFESVNLRYPGDIVYRYRLDEGPWSQPSPQEYIRLSGVESGTHQITISSVSRSGGQVLDSREVLLDVGEPWWNSWWMWLVYIALLGGAFYGAWRIYQLHSKYTRLVMDSPILQTVHGTPSARPLPKDAGGGRDFVDTLTRTVMEHLSEPDFSIDSLCREMGMSRTHLYVKLTTYTGKSPQEFIRFIRLERAAALLREGHPVADVSAMVGFDNPKYFSTVFKKHFEVSPSKYR